jgi:hypothetical protein
MIINEDENSINNTHTLTNKTDHMTKQFIPCTDGKNIFYCVNPKRDR